MGLDNHNDHYDPILKEASTKNDTFGITQASIHNRADLIDASAIRKNLVEIA